MDEDDATMSFFPVTLERPFALEWEIALNRLLALKDSVQNACLQSDKFTLTDTSGVKYFLVMHPNGDDDASRGNTWICFYLEHGIARKIESVCTLSINSANWSRKINHVFKKNSGYGFRCCTVNELFDSNKNFISDGKLLVRIEGILKIERLELKSTAKLHHEQKRTTELRNLWKAGFEDFTIIADGKELKVHKCVLACQSPVFEAMFNSSMKEAIENKVEIPDFPFETVEQALELCYHQNLVSDISLKKCLLLLLFTDKYDISVLKNNIEEYLAQKITGSNVCEIVNCAIAGNAPKLQNKCLDFFMDCLSMKCPVANMEVLDKDFLISVITKFSCHKSKTS